MGQLDIRHQSLNWCPTWSDIGRWVFFPGRRTDFLPGNENLTRLKDGRNHAVRRPLRHLVAYGSANKYRPESRSKASGNTARRPTLDVYFPCTTATMLTMTATVNAIDRQRWVCRTHLFQFMVLRSTPIHDF